MKPTYSTAQQIYSLCTLASASFTTLFNGVLPLQQATKELVLTALADGDIQKYIGSDWAVVWGPVVYSDKPAAHPTQADNTMMLLYSPSQNLLVLAIAGTNPTSAYDWLQEDLAVGTFVTWSEVMGSGFKINSTYQDAAISQGTATGLKHLLQMTNLKTELMLPTLMEALALFCSGLTQPATLAVTGHSLGGALSPAMAMYLNDSQQTTDWNIGQRVTKIEVYATAGPTSGNTTFADYIDYTASLTGTVTFSFSNQYNTFDVIPQAWEKETLSALPAIYEKDIVPGKKDHPKEALVGTMATVAFLKTLSKATKHKDVYQQPAGFTAMKGTFNTAIDNKVTSKLNVDKIALVLPTELKDYASIFVNFVRFLVQMVYQHTEAYNTLLGITEFADAYAKLKIRHLDADQSPALAREAAVSRIVGLDLSKFSLPDGTPEAAKVASAASAAGA